MVSSPGEAEVLRDPVVGQAGRDLPGAVPGEAESELVFAVFAVSLRPAGQQSQSATPPGVLPGLTDHGAEEAAGLLQGEEGGEVQVGQQEGDDGGRQGGEQGALSRAHHSH